MAGGPRTVARRSPPGCRAPRPCRRARAGAGSARASSRLLTVNRTAAGRRDDGECLVRLPRRVVVTPPRGIEHDAIEQCVGQRHGARVVLARIVEVGGDERRRLLETAFREQHAAAEPRQHRDHVGRGIAALRLADAREGRLHPAIALLAPAGQLEEAAELAQSEQRLGVVFAEVALRDFECGAVALLRGVELAQHLLCLGEAHEREHSPRGVVALARRLRRSPART